MKAVIKSLGIRSLKGKSNNDISTPKPTILISRNKKEVTTFAFKKNV
jgi:hypothetical protein